MKVSRYSYSALVLAAWLSQPFGALTQDQELTIDPGVYVREPASCKSAPNAAILLWDGVGFSGPHSSKCKSTVLSKRGRQYEISTSCAALGDGSSNSDDKPFVETFVLFMAVEHSVHSRKSESSFG